MDLRAYHTLELRIAMNPADPRRVMPPLRDDYRSVLDIGCGAGQTLLGAGFRPGTRSIGVDYDYEALRIGKQFSPDLCLVHARGEQLPLHNNAFDLVISRVALPYMRTMDALGEMTRVLKPGGTLWLVLHPFRQVLREMARFGSELQLRPVLHRLYVLANGISSHFTDFEFSSPAGGFETFQTEGGIRRRLEKLEYRDLKVQREPFFVVTATKNPWAAA
jgi:ubiquinone/menaquinone biosynthesis C-methylase UbiE